MKSVIIGTAGHIDHGKTSLVKVLTGVDTDRLPEEKARGLTIDIGFAFFDLNKDVRINFVDVPGHERFIKNMLAGATGIDAALLVVAADDGIMPQTREHLEILELLGIKNIFTAITKSDLVDKEWLTMVTVEVDALLNSAGFKDSTIIPVSSTNGDGIISLKEKLADLVLNIDCQRRRETFRLPIDRTFTVSGFGCVVTGSVVGGKVSVNDEIELLPAKIVSRIRGIEVNGEKKDYAVTGERAALNLAGIKSATVYRGCELSIKGYLEPVFLIDCELYLHPDTKKNLLNRARVRIHIFTSEVMGRVILLDRDVLKPGETCLVQLRLEKAIVAERGDRYIIRSYSPANTIGGGKVLRSYTHNLKRFKDSTIKPLKILASDNLCDIVELIISECSTYCLSVNEIQILLNVSVSIIKNVLDKLVSGKRVLIFNQSEPLNISMIHAGRLQAMEECLISILETFHKENKLESGIRSDNLKIKVDKDLSGEVFAYLITRLIEGGKIRTKDNKVSLYDFNINISVDDKTRIANIETIIKEQGYSPLTLEKLKPMLKGEMASNDRLLNYLIAEGTIVAINKEFYYHIDVINQLKEVLSIYINKNETIGVSEFRDLTNTTRKHAVPLLEYFDKTHFTKRIGDKRVLS